MPTPFTHLAIAQRLLVDKAVPQTIRAALHAERSAFLLGNIAADARVGSGAKREVTHFYAYGKPIKRAPWRVMMDENPRLMQPHDAAHRVFVAGFVAHLSVDEYWTKNFTMPQFGMREWADLRERFYMLHMILIQMDERDLVAIEPWQADTLCVATPAKWLPFINDHDLRAWRDVIHQQIKPGGISQTLDIFGERISRTPGEMRAIVDDADELQTRLWDHVPRHLVDEAETAMYAYSREQMLVYWNETA